MNPDYNEFEVIPSDSPKIDYIMSTTSNDCFQYLEGDGGEQFPVSGVPPEHDPVYELPRDKNDPEFEEPIEEYTEQVPQHYDYVAEGEEEEAEAEAEPEDSEE